MKRREFLAFVGGLTAWPLSASAQQQVGAPIIGFLDVSKGSGWSDYFDAFAQRLRELGWTEGRTLIIERRQAEGRSERYSEIAAEFVRLNVAVIVTGGIAVRATMQVTRSIPIVFAVANDPVGGGLVASLARPGGNATGLSLQAPDIIGKRLDFLRDVVPHLRRLAIVGNVSYPSTAAETREVQAVAGKLGIDAVLVEILRPGDIEPAFETLRQGIDAAFVCNDALVNANHARINALALGARLPTMHAETGYVRSGGLMSYAANYQALFRRAADIVDRILRGAKASDIPVEQPTKFELAINLKTAKALGLTVPEALISIADELVE
ncbi:ABC transporter substrate-binding protein [Bradyrhizobium sp. NP1]|uniref:ABC transporter substrate-binding protein n=1 Tax=Bradyrhizobium sp. NP1 TaxID=3049772 RepID=UPI0025A652C5|nr:ABC transporter substrate-binding protein [Bradyrhizobium sp. NP1]WJR77603.1 ABC transporter substrate-binding protein [Bradyrhizobium sp. NP1]